MSDEELDSQTKSMIEAMVKQWGKEMREHFAPYHFYRGNQNSWRQSQATTLSYSKRSFWEKEEQPKKRYVRPFVKPRSDSSSFSITTCDDGGVVSKEEREDPKVTVLEEQNEEVEEIEAPSGPLTLFDDSDLDVQNEEYDGEQQEVVIHVEDEVSFVSLTPTQVDEDDQMQLSKEVEMVKPKEEKVETNENGLMHESLLDQSSALEWIVNEEKKSMEAKWNNGNVSSLDCLFPFTYTFVQAYNDVSSKDTWHGILSIKRSEHQIELEGKKELESMLFDETKKKHNFFPFDVGGGQDLRTNPLQEEGNDGARKSWFEARRPRIIDDMG